MGRNFTKIHTNGQFSENGPVCPDDPVAIPPDIHPTQPVAAGQSSPTTSPVTPNQRREALVYLKRILDEGGQIKRQRRSVLDLVLPRTLIHDIEFRIYGERLFPAMTEILRSQCDERDELIRHTVNIDFAAECLDISPAKIRSQLARGDIPGLRLTSWRPTEAWAREELDSKYMHERLREDYWRQQEKSRARAESSIHDFLSDEDLEEIRLVEDLYEEEHSKPNDPEE